MATANFKQPFSADFLRALVAYDPLTGQFTWLRKTHFKNKPGDRAGHVNTQGYISLGIDAKKYLAHRLAWLHVHGEWPSAYIDHINGNKADNRIANLRSVSMTVNLQNLRGPNADNLSGLMGAHRKRDRWESRIKVGGSTIRLGIFDSPEAASAAYLEAKRRLHPGCTI